MTDGVHSVHVSATITNTGARAGTDVAQLYLGDPAASREPPRQLVAVRAGRPWRWAIDCAAIHDTSAEHLVVGSVGTRGKLDRWRLVTDSWELPGFMSAIRPRCPTCRCAGRST